MAEMPAGLYDAHTFREGVERIALDMLQNLVREAEIERIIGKRQIEQVRLGIIDLGVARLRHAEDVGTPMLRSGDGESFLVGTVMRRKLIVQGVVHMKARDMSAPVGTAGIECRSDEIDNRFLGKTLHLPVLMNSDCCVELAEPGF